MNPEGLVSRRDLRSDRPRRSFDSRGRGRHAMEEGVDPAREEALRFAKEVAGHIERACKAGMFSELVLAAAPEFLGQLRQYLSDVILRRARSVERNLVELKEADIRARLA
ncbi:MAG: host attachment protein [Chromatiales bacterium]